MNDDPPDRKRSGFKHRTRLDDARRRLLDAVEPRDRGEARTERLALASADGRALAESVVADRDVPHYPRVAMDGYAVRAEDTFGASDRSPAVLRASETMEPNAAVRVSTGCELPEGADSVVTVERTDAFGEDVEVFDAVAEGENVAPVGEDVEAGQHLYEPGHRLGPSDLGLLRSVGVESVAVRERPTVGVIPTGEELVAADPDPGEVIETNGLTVSRFVERWGGRPTSRDPVADDRDALRAAVQRDLTKDVVVAIGGSSVGERDLTPEVVADLGEIPVHGVALKPGRPVAVGVVEGTPIVVLPGSPVACIVGAVQLLRPALAAVGGFPCESLPTTEARLDRKIRSEPGIRTFARVTVESSAEAVDSGEEGERVATPVRVSGAGALSSAALADGWVVVPEGREGIPAGEVVDVEDWEWSA